MIHTTMHTALLSSAGAHQQKLHNAHLQQGSRTCNKAAAAPLGLHAQVGLHAVQRLCQNNCNAAGLLQHCSNYCSDARLKESSEPVHVAKACQQLAQL